MNNYLMFGFDDSIVASMLKEFKIIDHLPRVKNVHDVIAVPGSCALYDLNGCRVPMTETLYIDDASTVIPGDRAKIAKVHAILCPEKIKISSDIAIESQPSIFLGNFNRHYGHWLMDSMSRFWALPSPKKAVFAIERPSRVFIDYPYVSDVLNSLVRKSEIKPRPQYKLFESIDVIEPAFQHRHLMYTTADRAHLTVTRRMESQFSGKFLGKKIYLTRKFLSDQLRNIGDEKEIEDIFQNLGFEIIAPESLIFTDQLELFNSADFIAGHIGSAFHTAMFSHRNYQGKFILLCGFDPLNARFFMQSSIKNYTSYYLNVVNRHGVVNLTDLKKYINQIGF